MKSGKIVVVGSSNMDMVVKTDHIPVPGETVLSGSFFMNPGGKGANQAVAAARLGAEVVFISRLGNDIFGKQFSQLFSEENIETSYLVSDDNLPSGVALITVDKEGENSIVVAAGANANLSIDDINEALPAIAEAQIILMQLEIPMNVVEYVAAYAVSAKAKVILNPAPAAPLSEELLARIDILTPNETEASMIAGIPVNDIEDAQKAALLICRKGVKTVIVTLGSKGAVICENNRCTRVETKKVLPLDTTAAGDVFNGALAVALSEGKDIVAAVRVACDAAAISVTRLGAQSSIPYRNEMILNIAINKQ
ncbi:MAG: ribokinase [Chitinophagaceae bacterium]|nr:ribokinase [Chitinophagaceae bacterium]MCW5927212.1 ribokinase [Chitinophagaceae bacterium]